MSPKRVRYTFLSLVVITILVAVWTFLEYARDGNVRLTLGAALALGYLLSMIVGIVGLFSRWAGGIKDRDDFHRRAAEIYETASKEDCTFAITETFDLPEAYERAYKKCRARRMVFCGEIGPHQPSVLGALARVGMLSDRKDTGFQLRHIPKHLLEAMPPKLAGSSQAVAFGEPLSRGITAETRDRGTRKGWHVPWPALGRYVWHRIDELSKNFEDGEEIIAKELVSLAQTPGGCTLKDDTEVLLRALVTDGEAAKYWQGRQARVEELAIGGLRHIVHEHCPKV